MDISAVQGAACSAPRHHHAHESYQSLYCCHGICLVRTYILELTHCWAIGTPLNNQFAHAAHIRHPASRAAALLPNCQAPALGSSSMNLHRFIRYFVYVGQPGSVTLARRVFALKPSLNPGAPLGRRPGCQDSGVEAEFAAHAPGLLAAEVESPERHRAFSSAPG